MKRVMFLACVAVLGACASSRPITGRPPIPPGVPEKFLHFDVRLLNYGVLILS